MGTSPPVRTRGSEVLFKGMDLLVWYGESQPIAPALTETTAGRNKRDRDGRDRPADEGRRIGARHHPNRCRNAVYAAIEAGHLPAVRIGGGTMRKRYKIDPAALRAFAAPAARTRTE